MYGIKDVGKSALVRQLDFDVVDCIQIGTLCSSVDAVDVVLEYLELRYQTFIEMERHEVFVLDSVQGICPNIDESSA